MYQVQNSQTLVAVHRRLFTRGRTAPLVARTVMLLGLTSLLTDISSEMVSTVLPLYLVYTLGFTPLAVRRHRRPLPGRRARSSRLASGFVGDRLGAATRRSRRRLRPLRRLQARLRSRRAAPSARSRRSSCVDRTGKGIRTAPRDAMISLSTPKEQLGTAFGVHRALDTTGAMIGPLLAFGDARGRARSLRRDLHGQLLLRARRPRRLVLFVQNEAPRSEAAARGRAAPAGVLRARARPAAARRSAAVVALGCVLGLATISDGFVYLGLQRASTSSAASSRCSTSARRSSTCCSRCPVGRLADRVGRVRVFLRRLRRCCSCVYARCSCRASARRCSSSCILLCSARTTRRPTAC